MALQLHPTSSSTVNEGLWDPANLLQITQPDKPFEVQCVGRAKRRYDARCQWTLPDSDVTAVRAKLKQLSALSPDKVSQQDLIDLAQLSLCRQYHLPQWPEVSQRWRLVVAQAVRHYEQVGGLAAQLRRGVETLGLSGGEPDLVGRRGDDRAGYSSTAADEAEAATEQLHLDLKKAREDFDIAQARIRDLEEELKRAKQSDSQSREDYRSKISYLEKGYTEKVARIAELQKMLDTATTKQYELETRASSLRTWLETTGNRLEEERVKNKTLAEENKGLELRLSKKAEAVLGLEELLKGEKMDNKALVEAKEAAERRLPEYTNAAVRMLEVLDKERVKNKGLIEAADAIKHRLTERITTLNSDFKGEKDKVTFLEQEKKNLENRLMKETFEATQQSTEQKASIEILQDARKDLESQLSKANAAAKANAAKADRTNKENERLFQQNDTASNKIRLLQDDMDNLTTQVKQLEDKRSYLQQTLQQSQAETQLLKSANNNLTDKNHLLEAKVGALEEDLSRQWRNRLRNLVSRQSSGLQQQQPQQQQHPPLSHRSRPADQTS